MNFTRKFVNALGGVSKVAMLCDIGKSAVSQWCAKDKLPKAQENYLKTLYPEIYTKCVKEFKK